MSAFDDWRASGERFEHRGHRIFVRSGGAGGDGPTLLLIHGFPSGSWDWHALWEPLTARFARVLAPDLIGFGWSAKPRRHVYSIFDQADLCEGLLRARGVAEVHVLAHDYGDTVAQELLARHDERAARGDASLAVESMALLNGGLFPETHRPLLIQRLLLTRLGPLLSRLTNERAFGRSFARVFGAATKPSGDVLREYWRLFAHDGGARLAPALIRYIPERRANRERWVGALQSTKVPLRVIDGAEDPVSGAHMTARYRELVPSPDVVMLPGIGHYPQVEDPRRVLAAYEAFLDRVGSA